MIRSYKFTVEGRIQFPLDMLRYDACWPESTEDVAEIHATMDVETRMERRRNHADFRVNLITNHIVPTIIRWESFGWRVVK